MVALGVSSTLIVIASVLLLVTMDDPQDGRLIFGTWYIRHFFIAFGLCLAGAMGVLDVLCPFFSIEHNSMWRIDDEREIQF